MHKPLSGQQLERPWLGSPRSPPPACQPQSSQARERKALRPLPCPGGWRPALDWAGHPLGEYEGWALGKLPRQRSGGHRRQQPAAGPSAHWPEAPAAFPTPSHTHPRLPQLGPGLQGSRQGWGVAPGAEATTPTSRGACGVSRGMFGQVGVSPAPFPLQGLRENSPFPPTPQRQQAGEEAGEEAVEASYSSTPPQPHSPPHP